MSYQFIGDVQTLTVLSRKEWRNWLETNHDQLQVIWLVFYKKHTGKSDLTKVAAIEEAICFGWIDSIIRTIDDERYMQKFTPRKPDSIWSEVNKKKVEVLTELGLIHPAGQKLIDQAKARGEWAMDRSTPELVDPPDFFLQRLKNEPAAYQYWTSLTDKQRRDFALYMTLAKKEETKIRRSNKVIKLLNSQQLPNML